MTAPLPKRADLPCLAAATRQYAVATADSATHPQHQSLSEFLSRVRQALDMDIAFVSEFVDDKRVFRVVSAVSDASPVRTGVSDPLIDTYCKQVVEGRLPQAIPDTDALPEARQLAITQHLRIGAYLSVPIVLRDGRVYGTLCCFSHEAWPGLGSTEILGLKDVADVIARGLDSGIGTFG
jgi:GAF domain-containing protein